jgi:hypothetical protein
MAEEEGTKEEEPLEKQKVCSIELQALANKVEEHLKTNKITVERVTIEEEDNSDFLRDEETGDIPLEQTFQKIDDFVGNEKNVKVVITTSEEYIDVIVGQNRLLIGEQNEEEKEE